MDLYIYIYRNRSFLELDGPMSPFPSLFDSKNLSLHSNPPEPFSHPSSSSSSLYSYISKCRFQMLTQSFTGGANCLVLAMQDEQRVIRKAISDLSSEIERLKLTDEVKVISRVDEEEEGEVRLAECSCCGFKEECTAAYISEIERSFTGKWVCGICSEAVKERLLRFPNTPINEAVNIHMDFCNSFNSTTRLNPKLSLTSAMREIARKSSEKRKSSNPGSSKLARSISCDPRIGLKD